MYKTGDIKSRKLLQNFDYQVKIGPIDLLNIGLKRISAIGYAIKNGARLHAIQQLFYLKISKQIDIFYCVAIDAL